MRIHQAGGVTPQYTLTIEPTQDDVTVVINGEERTTLTADAGTAYTYSVSKTGYVTKTGSGTLSEDTTVEVTLAEEVTLTITPSPEEGTTVKIDGETVEDNQKTVGAGDTVTYSIEGEGYLTYTGQIEISEDTSITLLTRPQGTAVAWTDAESNTIYTAAIDVVEGGSVYAASAMEEATGTIAAVTPQANGLPGTITVADVVYTRDAESDVQPSP